jgi:hypothetical protein
MILRASVRHTDAFLGEVYRDAMPHQAAKSIRHSPDLASTLRTPVGIIQSGRRHYGQERLVLAERGPPTERTGSGPQRNGVERK